MKREIDFEILAEKINDSDLYEFVAFSNDVPVRAVNRDLDSIKEALNSHDKKKMITMTNINSWLEDMESILTRI